MIRDDYKSIGNHWIVLCVYGEKVKHFAGFVVEHISKEIKTFIECNHMVQ